MEAQLDHAFAIVREDLRHRFRGGPARRPRSRFAEATGGTSEVLVTVARTDAPIGEIMRTIERALRD